MSNIKYVIVALPDYKQAQKYRRKGGGETTKIRKAKLFDSFASAKYFMCNKYPNGVCVVKIDTTSNQPPVDIKPPPFHQFIKYGVEGTKGTPGVTLPAPQALSLFTIGTPLWG